MKNLDDKLSLMRFAPYIYAHIIDGKYICTAIIKNNNISSQELNTIQYLSEIKKLQENWSIYIWNWSNDNIYMCIAKALSEVIILYYQYIVKPKISESVRWEDFIFTLVIEDIINKIQLSPKPELYFQLIKSFITISQKVFDIGTFVTDIDDLEIDDIYMWEIFGAKFGKLIDGKNKNPILRIAYIYSLQNIIKSENITNIYKSEYMQKSDNSDNSDYSIPKTISIGNGRDKVLFDFNSFEKPKLLLHICCAPDLTYPLYRLKRYFKIYLFWYNPNIHPRAEHDLRYEQYLKLFELEEGDYEIVEDRYDPKEFFASFGKYRKLIKDGLEELSNNEVLKVAGDMEERSARCDPCYLMRLEQAATIAAKLWIPYFTSTLLISPKKVATKLFRRGLGAQERVVNSKFLRFDFAKKDGYNKASELTKDYDLYRQNYCGCWWTIPKKWESLKEYKWG